MSTVTVFAGQGVLVTGGSGGIGRVTCELFAAQGARVVVHYAHNEHVAGAVVDALDGDGHVAIRADLSNGGARRLADEARAALGRIDVLVNNAGISETHQVLTTSAEKWRSTWERTIATNLIAPADLIHAIAPQMVEWGGGRIVNVSSRSAFRGAPYGAAYGASKSALNSLSKSMAHALAPFGVYVTAIAPGFVDTDMSARYLDGPTGAAIRAQSPLNRVAAAAEVARVIVFLATPGTEYMTGTIVDVNGASYLR